ncbi:uncharacterized protein LOC142765163 [Rhipicephalus microplus]|uniref:uncharacterized protein LOC142765163 n=1 Tax=Rhipicephalus microplus TaxID=6941 RepID=UPI003F6CB0E8
MLADTFASAPTASAAVPVPVLPPHARPELFAPFRFFPTPAIVEAMGELCTANFSIRELCDVLDSRGAARRQGFVQQLIFQGFRAHRATADLISDVVSLLEEPKHRGEAGYLLLYDVKSAFDSLPHITILDGHREMRVRGNMLQYVEAFLSGRSFRVPVASELSGPRVVSASVPQGSVLSPFLFNAALARLIDHIPRNTGYEVRAAVYADDIALFFSSPTLRGQQVHEGLQAVIHAVDGFITGIGLHLSAAKTEAMHVHPKRTRCFVCPQFVLRGHRLPWKRNVRYLDLTIDHRLSWRPALASIRSDTRRIGGMASCILASGRGCSPDIALRFFSSVASARVLYAVPLVALRPAQWDALDTLHRGVVRRLYALPRSSPIGPTLAEAGETSLSLRARGSALRHMHRMYLTPKGRRLAERLLDRPHSGMGRFGDTGLEIKTTIPGIRSKKHTPQSALHQETVAMIEEWLAGRVLLYTDGSVTADGSAAAACFAPSLGLLAAVVYDSRAALLTLARGERGAPVAQRLARKFAVIVRNGCDVVFQWVPYHVGLLGNETADALAKEAHHPSTSISSFIRVSNVAHLRIARHVRALHPDSRVATGNPPRPLPRTGISRRARAFLLRLRTDCSRTAARRFCFTNSGSPSCAECPAEETTEPILLQCPGYTEQRRRLYDTHGRLGLPHMSLDHLRFPQTHHSRLMQAFEALFEFFGDAALIARL